MGCLQHCLLVEQVYRQGDAATEHALIKLSGKLCQPCAAAAAFLPSAVDLQAMLREALRKLYQVKANFTPVGISGGACLLAWQAWDAGWLLGSSTRDSLHPQGCCAL